MYFILILSHATRVIQTNKDFVFSPKWHNFGNNYPKLMIQDHAGTKLKLVKCSIYLCNKTDFSFLTSLFFWHRSQMSCEPTCIVVLTVTPCQNPWHLPILVFIQGLHFVCWEGRSPSNEIILNTDVTLPSPAQNGSKCNPYGSNEWDEQIPFFKFKDSCPDKSKHYA
jgi:hypothetical protein